MADDLSAALQAKAGRGVLLERLVDERRVSDAAVQRARLVADRTGQPVEQVLNQIGALSDEDLRDAYAAVTGLDVWSPDNEPVGLDALEAGLSTEFLRQRRVLPLRRDDAVVLCAVCDPFDPDALRGIGFAFGCTVVALVASTADWRREFAARYPDTATVDVQPDQRRIDREVDQVSDGGGDGAGARLVTAALEAAIALGASDVHFEPRRHDLRIRLRLDGRLTDHQVVSADLASPAVSRVKVVANLDLGERRLPQDGRTTFVVEGRNVDVRVSTIPTVFGESAVLRILDRANVALDLKSQGWRGGPAVVLERIPHIAHGMFLITGPTGSGKTTTLYALLQGFAGSTKKVLSVEDPVEYHFDHVTQTQVAPSVGLTFASALRAFLRQDPDVILVGEIRDSETASVAVQAAMTGHLVLASVHANDSLTVVPRLLDMGLEPYQLAAGLKGAAAQRLVGRLCPHCRAQRPSTAGERSLFVRAAVKVPETLFEPRGCSACQQGFRGRTAIGEAFMADDVFLRGIVEQRGRDQLAEAARGAGLVGLLPDGLSKAAEGLTTADEVIGALND